VTANLEGLANTLSNLERSRIVGELIQNSMDTTAKCIVVSLSKPKYGYADVYVEDNDPIGFENLKLAHEMFADTSKRNDPTKAGRFTIGEKRFLSLCRSAKISSTTGAEIFEKENGKENRRFSSKKREIGTRVDGSIEMTEEQFEETCNNVLKLIPHENVTIVFNGKEIPHRKPVFSFKATLKTEVANTMRKMVKVDRETTISLYEPFPGEKASLYELGIPVVETCDRWTVDVRQRIPLNSDRDNVTPSYLETIRALVVNHAHHLLTEQDVGTTWIREATSSDKINKEAYSDIMTKVFGEKKVIADPTDQESSKSAHANGFNPLYGRSLTVGEYENNRRFAAIPTSSSLFPTPKPYSNDPNAEPAEMIPSSDWTKGMKEIYEYTNKLSVWLLNTSRIRVRFMKHFNALACFSGDSETVGCGIDFNVGSLGKDFFANGITEEVDELILHEFSHYYCSDHLDERYYHALSKLGAKLKRLAVEESVQITESHKIGVTVG
jgi:hypothetical protein